LAPARLGGRLGLPALRPPERFAQPTHHYPAAQEQDQPGHVGGRDHLQRPERLDDQQKSAERPEDGPQQPREPAAELSGDQGSAEPRTGSRNQRSKSARKTTSTATEYGRTRRRRVGRIGRSVVCGHYAEPGRGDAGLGGLLEPGAESPGIGKPV